MSAGLIPDELLDYVPHTLTEVDPTTGEWRECYRVRRRTPGNVLGGMSERQVPLFMNLTPFAKERLTAGGCYGLQEGRIPLVASADEARLSRGSYGETELDRIALYNRHPKYVSAEDLARGLCAPRTARNLESYFRDSALLRAIVHVAIDGAWSERDRSWTRFEEIDGDPLTPGPVTLTLGELLQLDVPTRCCPDNTSCDTSESFSTVLHVVVSEFEDRQLYGDDDECEVLYLKSHLTGLAARRLEEFGVLVELDGDRVHLQFVDPCLAHRERLGR